jgi:RNA polymerase sigma-70 factor, ECF subfamily
VAEPTIEPNRRDDELVHFAAGGNELAFADLIARHRRMIYSVVRRFFRQYEDVEEMAHLSFIGAWFAISSYHGGGAHSFAAWLARIATNTCYDELRRRQRFRERVVSQLSDDELGFLFKQESSDVGGGEVETKLIYRDLTDKLLNLLEPDDRKVLVMLKSENYSVAEVAKKVGWTETKVKMRVHRSRSILRRRSHRLM